MRRAGADLGRGRFNINRNHRGRLHLDRIWQTRVRPASGQDLLGERGQGGHFAGLVLDQAPAAKQHRRAVVHRVVEDRLGQHEAIHVGDRHAHLTPLGDMAQHPAGRRAVQQQCVAFARVQGRDYIRAVVDDKRDVADQAGVDDRKN